MSKPLNSDLLLIGAHTSTAGGAHNALFEGKAIGATTVQIFTANQRQWRAAPLTEEKIEAFHEALGKTQLRSIMSHGSYLVNLGSPVEETLQKSRAAFSEEIERCLAYGISLLNFHPGSALESSREDCLERIYQSLMGARHLLGDDRLRLVLELTAGQGSSVGCYFEEIGALVDKLHSHLPIGVCIDTCHIFAAGYDIRTESGWRDVLARFDKTIGLKYLAAFHLNDSLGDLGSRKDRHANLGEGKIGLSSFRFLMQHPPLAHIPKYLETPDGPVRWEKEIALLRKFASGSGAYEKV